MRFECLPFGADVAGTTERVGAPTDTDHRHVVEQQAIDLDDRDVAGGEADDEEPPLLAQHPQRIGEAVTTHRVDDDVDAAPHVVAEPVHEHDLVGTCLSGDLPLGLRRDHRDDPARTERLGDLDRRRPDAARRAVHQDGLPCPQATALDQSEVGRAVVEQERRPLLEAHVVREPEGQVRPCEDLLCEPTEHAQ